MSRRNNKEEEREYQREYYDANKERLTDYKRKWRIENFEKFKNQQLLWKFGITISEYNDMFSEQEGKCVICGIHQNELTKSLAVDHCHETGNIRGLLCQTCNLMLGYSGDDIEILKKSIKYLNKN